MQNIHPSMHSFTRYTCVPCPNALPPTPFPRSFQNAKCKTQNAKCIKQKTPCRYLLRCHACFLCFPHPAKMRLARIKLLTSSTSPASRLLHMYTSLFAAAGNPPVAAPSLRLRIHGSSSLQAPLLAPHTHGVLALPAQEIPPVLKRAGALLGNVSFGTFHASTQPDVEKEEGP